MLRALLWTALLGGVGAAAGYGVARCTTPLYAAHATALLQAPPDAAPKGEAATLLRSPSLFHAAAAGLAPSPAQETALRNRLVVSDAEPGNAIELVAESPDPNVASRLLTGLIGQYNVAANKANRTASGARRAELVAQLSAASGRLHVAQQKLSDYQTRTGIVALDTDVQNEANYQAELERERDADAVKLQGAQHAIAEQQALLPELAPTAVGVETMGVNPRVTANNAKMAQLQSERVDLLGTYAPTSLEVGDVDAKIAALKVQMAKDDEAQMKVLEKQTGPNPQREALLRSLAENQAEAASLAASLAQVAKAQTAEKLQTKGLPKQVTAMIDLQREVSLAGDQYKTLRGQVDQLAASGPEAKMPLLATLMPPRAGMSPVWPDYGLLASVGGAAGLLLGLVIGVAGLAGGRAVEPAPLPEPGGPELPVRLSAPSLPKGRGRSLADLALPGCGPAEAYRFMVYSLQARGEEARTLLFTGVTSDRLCSEASAQFAIAMAQTGVRTLLADCNLRDQTLTDAFGFKGRSGISDMLSRTMLPGSELLLETEHPDLYFMPSGSEEAEGLGAFPNLQVVGLVEDLVARADVKVINAPACAVVSDAPRLVRFADQVCLVASKADQRRGLVERAQAILRRAGAPEIDVLVIDDDASKTSFLG